MRKINKRNNSGNIRNFSDKKKKKSIGKDTKFQKDYMAICKLQINIMPYLHSWKYGLSQAGSWNLNFL